MTNAAEVQTVLSLRVSGGELAQTFLSNGRVRYYFQGKRVDLATAHRLAHR
jgi:hypothetical protein